ncbi:MAG TPA: UDP-N-acetylglucosamine 2-epimerase (non-hydrolyzing) [Candidatus Limnocylindrales bacterium]|nr:UDP-N-acetylglucosamine 2-epimerase (non-hydrolyzing) [Candidatus Limnocylindrales bacterium]
MKLVCVVGTRPQLIKAAAAWPALREAHQPVLVDTGQHYDEQLAGTFFAELGLPLPDHELGVGSGSHARQTAAMLDRLEPLLLDERPDAVVVFGDTNSTLAGALAASKLDLALAHVEAGLRSYDRRMPEELNRVVVDHLSGLLLVTGDEAARNLRAEGIAVERLADADGADADSGSARHHRQRIVVVGDLMQDLLAATIDQVRQPDSIGAAAPDAVRELSLRPGEYLFATVHRAENREPAATAEWLRLLGELDRPVALALHPGTKRVIDEHGSVVPAGVHLLPPLGYRTTLALQLHAAAVVTDSGGVQREAHWLGVPALVLRETTEWPETLVASGGRALLVGRDSGRARAALGRLAPGDSAAAEARRRAAGATVAPAGVARAVAGAVTDWLAG